MKQFEVFPFEVEIDFLALMVARGAGGACFHTFTLLFTSIHFYSLLYFHTLTLLQILYTLISLYFYYTTFLHVLSQVVLLKVV